ncbi:hypothetical protein [Microcoleus sp. bin38.metabat.b11b12b14.051]|uniref:hypothetical protein n=1 Tax=Microcoleus sp. bin38.metabat.b11b12b14.051 TaxID=2742709 RepID=UPI0025D3CE71|nr:hypothetical protein [Microcoleus sp. bin38.metabat.b11b12b14.051]
MLISILRAVRPWDEGVFTEPVRDGCIGGACTATALDCFFFTLPNVRGAIDSGIVANRIYCVVFAVLCI